MVNSSPSSTPKDVAQRKCSHQFDYRLCRWWWPMNIKTNPNSIVKMEFSRTVRRRKDCWERGGKVCLPTVLFDICIGKLNIHWWCWFVVYSNSLQISLVQTVLFIRRFADGSGGLPPYCLVYFPNKHRSKAVRAHNFRICLFICLLRRTCFMFTYDFVLVCGFVNVLFDLYL